MAKRNKYWDKKEDKYLIKNYLTEDINSICKKLNRSKTSIIQRATGKLGIKKSGLPENVAVDDLIKKYKELQSTRKVGKVFNIHSSKVGYYLKKAGITNEPIRYTCDDDFFKQDTQETFYWAGFIAADGCVKLHSKKYKQLQIGLAYKDYEHVDKFKKAISFNGPIGKYAINTGGFKLEITISSDQLFDDLSRFNIVPRKSLTYTFPEWLIKHPLVNHFMRGYNDGDGSFYRSISKGRKIEQLYFSLRGTKEFLEVFNSVLKTNCEFNKDKKPRSNSGIYILEFGGTRKVGKIRDFLYKDSTTETRLERKYDISYDEKFTDIPENYKFKKVIGINIEAREQIILNSIKDGEEFGFLRQGISACCRGKGEYHNGYIWYFDGEEPKVDINSITIKNRTSWSKENLKYLKSHYSTVDTDKIATKLGFSIDVVRGKAMKLGLSKKIKGTTARSIVGKDESGNTIKYSSITEARNNGLSAISRALKSGNKYKGYTWKYEGV